MFRVSQRTEPWARVAFIVAAAASILTGIICTSVNAEVRHKARTYRLGPGDTLALIVHGVVGEFGSAPVHFPSKEQETFHAIGHPIQVQNDGTLNLPQIDAVKVNGHTVAEARRAIGKAYVDAKIILDDNVVMASLLRKRRVHVTVVHSDPVYGTRRSEKVQLTANQSTLMGALAKTEAFDARASVRIQRPSLPDADAPPGTIPTGSILHLSSLRDGYYYTGGKIAGGQHRLSAHQPLNVVQAIAAAGGYQQTGILPPRSLTIVRQNGASAQVPLRHVLNAPGNYIVRPGDHLVVR